MKQWLFSDGRKLYRLRAGVAKGMLMELDLLHQSQYYWGFYERELFPVLQRLIPSCRSLIDVGANDGYYTMAFLKSSAERVVACEPGPATQQLLNNAEANGYQPGERFLLEKRLIGPGEEMVSIADLVSKLPRPILCKVDIDGGEVDLLGSAEGCSFLPDLSWVIETHTKELEEQCVQWLHAYNYKTQIIYNASWRSILPEKRPLAHNRWLVAEPN